MTVQLDADRRAHAVTRLRGWWIETFDEELTDFRAEQLVDFLLDAVGAPIYNQGVEDARAFMMRRLEDLEAEVHALDELA